MAGASQETAEFKIERVTIEKGKTFSADAMATLLNEVNVFIMEHVAARWDVTGEPPTYLNVKITTDIG